MDPQTSEREMEDSNAQEDEADEPDLTLVGPNLSVDQYALRMIRSQIAETKAKGDRQLEPDEPIIIRTYLPKELELSPEVVDIVPTVKDSLTEEALFYTKYKHKFPPPATQISTSKQLLGKFHILLAADSFELCNEGVAALNRCLATELMIANAGTVTSTVFEAIEEIPAENMETAKKLNVKLVSLKNTCIKYRRQTDNKVNIYRDIVINPEKYTEIFYSPEPNPSFPTFTHIVGHVPVTHEYALALKRTAFRLSKLVMFFHIIPDDLIMFADRLNVEVPTLSRLIDVARQSDVVYSVSRKVFDYFTIVFRARNVIDIDHRLYIPSAPKEVFDTPINNHFYDQIGILTSGFLCNSTDSCYVTNGLDVVVNAITKLKQQGITFNDGTDNKPLHLKLIISHLSQEAGEKAVELLQVFGDTSFIMNRGGENSEVKKLFNEANFFISPKRCESYGFYGLYSFCAGMPSLVPEDSATASVITDLFDEASDFLLPVNKNQNMYRQNGNVWCQRLSNFIRNYDQMKTKAEKLKIQLLSDEMTRNTHDNFLSFVLGGIQMKIRVVSLVPLDAKEKDKMGLRLRFEELLVKIMRVCWRLKSHTLESCTNHEYMGSQLARGVVLPVDRIINRVFNKIEEMNRRVVAIDDESKSLVIFCPTRKALRNLWADCDTISRALLEILAEKEECNSLLNNYKIKSVETEMIIEGSEFYKLSQFLETVYEKM